MSPAIAALFTALLVQQKTLALNRLLPISIIISLGSCWTLLFNNSSVARQCCQHFAKGERELGWQKLGWQKELVCMQGMHAGSKRD
ncbi:hypothetical protein AAT19DRAFT_9670 [Rhodotorula toruloides]|uniref:Uncharacterized protein n=1 Tax=Rhodotorula toruloides TaxID=5286 RepID=A0A2T0A2W1_RHOTO|nr:hypothetical protein AAT19DRAFT_9670 [Rhodotorula toruloides]